MANQSSCPSWVASSMMHQHGEDWFFWASLCLVPTQLPGNALSDEMPAHRSSPSGAAFRGAQVKGLLWEKWLPSHREGRTKGTHVRQAVGCLFSEEPVGHEGSSLLLNSSAVQWQGTCGGEQVGTLVLNQT